MKKLGNRLKLTLGLSVAVLVLLAVAPVVHGGLSWTGIDPVLLANGHTLNVWVEWPTGRECSINGPILVEVHARATLLAESMETFNCATKDNIISTATMVKAIGIPSQFKVEHVFVPSTQVFPVRVKVYKDGELGAVCESRSNQLTASLDCDRVISLD